MLYKRLNHHHAHHCPYEVYVIDSFDAPIKPARDEPLPPIKYELPIVIEKYNIYAICAQDGYPIFPKEVFDLIEKHRIAIIIEDMTQFRSVCPFETAISIRYDGYCPLLRTTDAIVRQFQKRSKVPPRISYIIAYMPQEQVRLCIEYLEGLMRLQQ